MDIKVTDYQVQVTRESSNFGKVSIGEDYMHITLSDGRKLWLDHEGNAQLIGDHNGLTVHKF